MTQFLEYDASSLSDPFPTFRNSVEKMELIGTASYSRRMESQPNSILYKEPTRCNFGGIVY